MTRTDSPASDRLVLPDWLPVLRRGAGTVQVGLNPDAGIVFSGVADGAEHVLALLDGAHTIAEVRASASRQGIDEEQSAWMVRMLDEAGLLTRSGPHRESHDRIGAGRVRLVGCGVLARSVAMKLALAGVGRIYVASGDDRDDAAAVLCGRLKGEGPSSSLQPVRHWTKPEHPPPDLTVIALDVAEPGRTISDWLTRAGHPHLFVRPLLGGAVVGPMVHPGRTPCIGCLDHVRRDADPEWPRLLDQLGRRPMPMAPVMAEWAGVTTAIHVGAALCGRDPVTAGATVEILPDDFEARVRQWPMHPSCRCAWYG